MTQRSRLLILASILAGAAGIGSILHGHCIASSLLPSVSAGGEAGPVERPGVRAEGRLVAAPGAQVTIGTELGGRLVSLSVRPEQTVRAGDAIAEIASDEQRAALAEARARVLEADADIRLAASERDRAARLVAASVGTAQALERAERDLDAARARRATAAATADRLSAALAKARIVAPIDGVVLDRFADAGETVAPGSPICTIADLSRTRIEAEVDELDAGRVAIGHRVDVTAEGFDATWSGKVSELPHAVVPRRLDPQDPARPSDMRVLLVKVELDGKTPLRLGQKVDVEIR
ncbi:MAG: efflux RND transporter periplasmic adaptor subunit [Acidobacteriota bacterium]